MISTGQIAMSSSAAPACYSALKVHVFALTGLSLRVVFVGVCIHVLVMLLCLFGLLSRGVECG